MKATACRAGQVLATIDDAQPRAAWSKPRPPWPRQKRKLPPPIPISRSSESTLKRYQQLYDKKSVSPQEFDEIKARRQSAEARRDMARAQQAQANAALTQARTTLGYTQDSRAVCRRGDGKKGRRGNAGLAGHAPVHHGRHAQLPA